VGITEGIDSDGNEVARCELVDWGIRSDILDPLRITSELGIQPSRAWAKGERYLGKALDVETRRIVRTWYAHPWGTWALETRGLVTATSVEPHVLSLLELLEPRRDIIKHYLDNTNEFTIRCLVWWQSNIGHGGFDLSSGIIARMAALCHYFQFTWVPPPDSQEDDE
jgi:hypothetical protein